MKSIVSHFSARKNYLFTLQLISQITLVPVYSRFFPSACPRSSTIKGYLSHVSGFQQCSCLSCVTDTAALAPDKLCGCVCVSGNALSFKSYLAPRHKFLSVVFFTQSHTARFVNHYRCIFQCILYVSK